VEEGDALRERGRKISRGKKKTKGEWKRERLSFPLLRSSRLTAIMVFREKKKSFTREEERDGKNGVVRNDQHSQYGWKGK